jgi:hypothetical protein
VREPVERIGERVGRVVANVLHAASDEGLPPARVAVREAERRLDREHVGVAESGELDL